MAGHAVEALRVAGGARKAASVKNMTILSAELALAEAIARREMGDRSQAEVELEVLFASTRDPMLYVRVLAGIQLVLLHLDDGDTATARRVFDTVVGLVDAEDVGAPLRSSLAQAGTALALASRRLDEARRWAAAVDDPFWSGVCKGRVDLADGDRSSAEESFEAVEPRCPRHEVVKALVQAQAVGRADEAGSLVELAVRCAVGNNMLQTVASEGADVVAMVEPVACDVPKNWIDRLRRAAGRTGPLIDDAAGLFETLTERERDVLRFLPSRLTVREIADELYISVNTLKFHLRVIYRKLDVRSRAEAVEIVRDQFNR
jgi:LuxR family maltose regulon positive regulatory protein